MPDPSLAPALLWLAAQLVPSPEVAVSHGDASHEQALFGMRWQVTPALWSFGIHRGVSPWRTLLVEPMVRHSGSIELFVSPEYLALPGASDRGTAGDRWFLRPGARAYFPLAQHGEYLSCSIGTSYAWGFAGRSGAAWEAGVYTLFGVLGLQVTYSPTREPADVIATLSVRYF